MTQKTTLTLAARLAAYFEAHPDRWIDGMELARIAGSYAWRSRCSDLRRAPYGMQIDNRVRTVEVEPGRFLRVSEYRFSREQAASAA